MSSSSAGATARRDLFGDGGRRGGSSRSRHAYRRDDGGGYDDDEDDDADGCSERDAFIKRHVRLQQMERKKQDENLDVLHDSVHRLGEISVEISNELDEQNKMLEELGDDIDRSQGAMDNIARKTKELVELSGGPGYCCMITALSAIAFILFLLIIYT